MARYRILAWRDIPTQIRVVDDTGTRVDRMLPRWFMQEISRITMREGFAATDDYVAEFEWSADVERDGTADEIADRLVAEITARFGRTEDGRRIARTDHIAADAAQDPPPSRGGSPVARFRVLAWKDIPTQVQATDGTGARVKRHLGDWFMQEVDRVAMRDGLTGTDQYTTGFAWSRWTERDGTADEVAAAVEAELLAKWDRTA